MNEANGKEKGEGEKIKENKKEKGVTGAPRLGLNKARVF